MDGEGALQPRLDPDAGERDGEASNGLERQRLCAAERKLVSFSRVPRADDQATPARGPTGRLHDGYMTVTC